MYARGDNRHPVFLDSADRTLYLSLLAREVKRNGWRCLGYCLMLNHLHLVLETPEPNLGIGMHGLQGGYARRFNHRHGRVGHVFQGRYGAVRVKDDAQFAAVVRYVAQNPVEAGYCERPDEWRWGSHRAVVGERWPAWLDAARLLGLLSSGGRDRLARYRALTEST